VLVRSASRRDLPVRSVIHRWITHCLRRGLKSRADSGAKAPHSIWSAAIYRRFSVEALAFTTLPFAVFSREHRHYPQVGAIHELPLPHMEGPACGGR
jgi:hypothetical protein